MGFALHPFELTLSFSLSLWGNSLSVVVLLGYLEFWAVLESLSVCLSLLLLSLSSDEYLLTGFCHLFGFIIILLFMFWDLFVSLCMLLLSRCHYIRCRCVTSCFIWFVLWVSCDVLGFTSFVSWWMISFTYTLVSAAVSPVCPFQFKFKKLKHQSVSFWIKPLMRLWVLRLT